VRALLAAVAGISVMVCCAGTLEPAAKPPKSVAMPVATCRRVGLFAKAAAFVLSIIVPSSNL
jgi:hypothetical protein